MPKTPPKRYTSLSDAAAYLGCTDKTVRRLISNGSLTGYRLGRRAIRVDLNEVESLLKPIPAGGELV